MTALQTELHRPGRAIGGDKMDVVIISPGTMGLMLLQAALASSAEQAPTADES